MKKLACLVAMLGAVGCSSEVEDQSGTGGTAGTGGVGGVEPPVLDIASVNAPDEYTITIHFTTALSAEAAEAADLPVYAIDSTYGALVVEGVAVGPDSVTLTTEKQKLGVTYDLALASPGGPLDGLAGSFVAADTASFWATDLSSPNFDDYQLVANRVEVGEHTVVYVEKGYDPWGVTDAVNLFDTQSFPIETELFRPAPDRDGNGRILLLGLNGHGAYGGYYSPINTLTEAQAQSYGYHSNEMEMLHIAVEGGDFDGWGQIIAHEFQHLLNQEKHPFSEWDYHNEGLAECAVHAVLGNNDYAVQFYVGDPYGTIAPGESLVQWNYGNYDQYALAYVFWSYIASQLDGVTTYGDLFDVDGSPSNIQAFLQATLGKSFGETQLGTLVASRAQAATGPNGFNGLVDIPGFPPTTNDTSLSLAPFAGTFVNLGAGVTSVDYPGNQGPDIVYAGITGAGVVDLVAPFDVTGGVLVVLNTELDPNSPSPQPAGPSPLPKPLATLPAHLAPNGTAWMHPPPFNPWRLDAMRRWQEATRGIAH